MPINQSLLDSVKAIAQRAGQAIMEVYERAGAMESTAKQDNSPLTEADLAAHHIIEAGLQALEPELPVLSEESRLRSWRTRKAWNRYWLVDPLDGTREFIKRNDEFTVNIALVVDGVAVLGVVYAPALNRLYCGLSGHGAWREDSNGKRRIHTRAILEGQQQLAVVASRSHHDKRLGSWLAKAETRFSKVDLRSMGSSLKICLVAEGEADIYPRLAPTSEWDTAAAHAVLEAAGGSLVDTRLRPLRYNSKEGILNPWFVAMGDPGFHWASLAFPLDESAEASS